jgi:hypothetical protein
MEHTYTTTAQLPVVGQTFNTSRTGEFQISEVNKDNKTITITHAQIRTENYTGIPTNQSIISWDNWVLKYAPYLNQQIKWIKRKKGGHHG